MKSLIEWLVSKKDIITTIAGVLAGLYQIIAFLQEYVNSPNPEFGMLVSGLFTIIIGWFTGKTLKK